MPPPNKRTAPAGHRDGSESIKQVGRPRDTKSQPKAQQIIAEIDKSHCSRLRVTLENWRGNVLVDLRECTANIPGMYWPTNMGVRLPVYLVDQLIAALQAARASTLPQDGSNEGGLGDRPSTDQPNSPEGGRR